MATRKNSDNRLHWVLAIIALVIVALLGFGAAKIFQIRATQIKDISDIQASINDIDDLQKSNQLSVVDTATLDHDVSQLKHSVDEFDMFKTGKQIDELNTKISANKETLEQAIYKKHAEAAAAAALAAQRAAAKPTNSAGNTTPAGAVQLPILMYHKPPADFDAQMAALKNKGYTTVHMSDVANFFNGGTPLPPKPVVVTLDDGFTAENSIIPSLQKYNQKATLYLIVGGDLSNYCIGLLRHNTTCGDAYLTIADVKGMLNSGRIEIGSHTLDHPNLAGMSADQQWQQITQSKSFLESTFGQSITSFAYPYGSYNATTVALMPKAGYATAVTTEPGITQYSSERYLLHRVRDAYSLP